MTKQYGIIYKFTIVTKLKMDGQRPSYIGQHITYSTPEEFLSRNYPYYGSGSIWGDFLEKLRELNPNNWRCLIKREILFSSDKVTQRGLDAMEAYYIKREKSHYSFRIGGCNVLWGTANQFGSGNPAKDPRIKEILSNLWKTEEFREKQRKTRLKNKKKNREIIRQRIETPGYREKLSISQKQRWENMSSEKRELHRERIIEVLNNSEVKEKLRKSQLKSWTNERRKHMSKVFKTKWENSEFKDKMIERNGQRGKPLSDERKKKISLANKGRKFSDEHRKKLSEAKKKIRGKEHPCYGKKASPILLKNYLNLIKVDFL